MSKRNRNKRLSAGVVQLRSNFHEINGISKKRKIFCFKLKQNLSFPELCDAVDYVERNLNIAKKESFTGRPLPQSYAELGDLGEFPILGLYSNGTLTPTSLTSELNLVLTSIRKYKYEINLFIKYKELYESYLITGDYYNAEIQLSKIENEICHSLWSLENRFVLKELSGKASENKEFLSYFNETNSSTGITKYLAHYLSLRAEHSLSVNRYYSDLDITLNNIKSSDTKDAFINYYKFKLTFLNHINFNNYGEIIALDFSHSIIDRYLTLTRILTNLLAAKSKNPSICVKVILNKLKV